MNVLAVVPLYPPHSPVGAWITTHEFLADLATRGHHIDVRAYMSRVDDYTLDGVHVHHRTYKPTDTPDVVVQHLGDNGEGARTHPDVPHVVMIHSTRSTRRVPGLAVFNSHTARDDHPTYDRWVVAHPPVDPARYATTPGERVTLVNLSASKGGQLFWRLAAAMPDVQFQAVRGCYGSQQVRRLPNVTNVGVTIDMRDVYRETRILVVPSLVESWGRVGIEAMASGIPVIAHPTPGLVESLGDAGIFVDRSKPSAWQTQIRRLHDPHEWAAASLKSIARAAELDPQASLDTFAEAVEELVPVRA